MELILSFLIATVLGLLTGLGAGAGSLLLLYLTAFAGMDPHTARTISLLFFFPAALTALWKNRRSIPWKDLVPGIFGGVLSAFFLSFLARTLDPGISHKLLGVLFLLLGLRELFLRR